MVLEGADGQLVIFCHNGSGLGAELGKHVHAKGAGIHAVGATEYVFAGLKAAGFPDSPQKSFPLPGTLAAPVRAADVRQPGMSLLQQIPGGQIHALGNIHHNVDGGCGVRPPVDQHHGTAGTSRGFFHQLLIVGEAEDDRIHRLQLCRREEVSAPAHIGGVLHGLQQHGNAQGTHDLAKLVKERDVQGIGHFGGDDGYEVCPSRAKTAGVQVGHVSQSGNGGLDFLPRITAHRFGRLQILRNHRNGKPCIFRDILHNNLHRASLLLEHRGERCVVSYVRSIACNDTRFQRITIQNKDGIFMQLVKKGR